MNYKFHYFHLQSCLKILSYILLMASVANVFAKGGESHGGDAVVCFDRPYFLPNHKIDPLAKIVTAPRLKDFWEFSQLSSFPLVDVKNDLYFDAINYLDLADTVISQVKRVDPALYYRMAKKMVQHQEIFRYTQQAVLSKVNDSFSTIRPDSNQYCYEVQLALFDRNSLPGQGFSVINDSLFKKMSDLDKAGLIVHELLWFEFSHLEQKIKNLSYYVRYLTYLLFSKNFLKDPFFDFFYIKNIYLSGTYDLMQHSPLDRYLLGDKQFRLIPAPNYSYQNSETFSQLQLQFNSAQAIFLPGEIWEANRWREITPHQSEKYQICINLESEDLKHHGSCHW